jgi:hypothetical protein
MLVYVEYVMTWKKHHGLREGLQEQLSNITNISAIVDRPRVE